MCLKAHDLAVLKSFAVETTLRTTAAVEQADLARKHGFSTELLFIATNSIAENIARVLQRAQGAGRRALVLARRSETFARSKAASIANLKKALSAFDRANVYDSTPSWTAPRLVATAENGKVVLHGSSPAWLEGGPSTADL
jgi:predicted ABC-type ATPase